MTSRDLFARSGEAEANKSRKYLSLSRATRANSKFNETVVEPIVQSNRHSVALMPQHTAPLPPLHAATTTQVPARPARSKTPPQRFQSAAADSVEALSAEKESGRRSKLGSLRDALSFKSKTLKLSSLRKKASLEAEPEPPARPVSMALPRAAEQLPANVTSRARPRSALYTSMMSEGLLAPSTRHSKGGLGDVTVGEVLGLGLEQDNVITSPLYAAETSRCGSLQSSPNIRTHASPTSGLAARCRGTGEPSSSPKAPEPVAVAISVHKLQGFEEFEDIDLLDFSTNSPYQATVGSGAGVSTGDDWQEFTTAEAYEQRQASSLPDGADISAQHGHVCDLSQDAEAEAAEAEEQGAVLRTIEGAGVAGLELARTLFALLLRYSELLADGLVLLMQAALPVSLHKYLHQVAPLIRCFILAGELVLACCLVMLELLAEAVYALHRVVKPFRPGLLAMVAAGLVVCFFGGFFALSIAAAEAFCLCGYQTTLSSVRHVAEDIQAYLRKSRPVPMPTAGNSGEDGSNSSSEKVDTNAEATSEDFAEEKPRERLLDSRGYILQQLYLLLVHVDPHRLSEALLGLNSGAVAVLSTLKLQFAKTVTLGQAIAQSLQPVAARCGPPLLDRLLPAELRKWSPFLCEYGLKLLAISAAWRMRRVVATYHSALRGGGLCSKYIAKYLVAVKLLPRATARRYSGVVVLCGYALAGAGLYVQYRAAFQLPYPLNVLLFPVTVLESCLLWVVNHSVYLPAFGVV